MLTPPQYHTSKHIIGGQRKILELLLSCWARPVSKVNPHLNEGTVVGLENFECKWFSDDEILNYND